MRNGKLSKKDKAEQYDALDAKCSLLECFIWKRKKLVTFREVVDDPVHGKYVIEAHAAETPAYDAVLELVMDKTWVGILELAQLREMIKNDANPYTRGALSRLHTKILEYVRQVWDAEAKVKAG